MNIGSEDRDPNKVIEEDFGGDRDGYLRKMAEWHGISINDG